MPETPDDIGKTMPPAITPRKIVFIGFVIMIIGGYAGFQMAPIAGLSPMEFGTITALWGIMLWILGIEMVVRALQEVDQDDA